MSFLRRKKQIPKLNIEISEGVYLGQPGSIERENSFLNCVPKAVLVFLVVFGSLGGFISAFHVECNYVIPGIVLFVTALYFAGLFAFRKGWQKDLGYIIYFIFFVIGIYLFKSYVNSGFAAIVNMVRQRGELYFDLSAGTEFAENIEDRYLTVTITFIFIGIFEIILLNIFISNYMSLKLTLFVTLPIYSIPLYFESEPNLFFVFCMLCGYTGIYIFKNSGHFRDGESRKGYKKEKNGKYIELSYAQNNKVYCGVLLAVICCVLLTGAVTLFYDSNDLRKQYTENQYKTATREGVSGFIMLGFRSFFPNLYARGGMSGGNLGRFSALRPDNETDLLVRFAPYDTNPVYLKAYTGLRYMGNQWYDGYRLMGSQLGRSEYFYTESMAYEAAQLEKAYEKDKKNNAKAVMEITNKGADVSYVYYPYFTRFKEYDRYTKNKSALFVGSGLNDENSYTFYPNLNFRSEIKDMDSYIYREVPEQNQEAIDEFLDDAGISSGDTDAVQKVVDYLKTEYSYSYNPGRAPDGEDFINYFLSENKKGVCAHFASAATLIFRRLGISARYVEGYAFGYSQVLEGKIREDLKYEDYYSGYAPLGKTAVMEVEVTDANAHAWVEIYQDGKGWMVIDPTPAVMDEEESGSDFWGSVKKFWDSSPDVSIQSDLSGVNLGFLRSGRLHLAAALIGILVIGAFLVRFLVLWILRWRQWHTKSLRQNMLWYYRELCRKKAKKDVVFAGLTMPSEQMAYLASQMKEEVDVSRIVCCLEAICFGPGEPERGEYDFVMKVLRKMS